MKQDSRLASFGRGLAVAWLLTLIGPLAYPQSSTGSVRGTVRDQTEAVVPNAGVTLTNAATNVTSKGKTNETGFYVFPVVTPGQYRIMVDVAGMQKYQATLTVQVQQSTTADAVMRVSSETVSVSVRDITPVTVTDQMSLGHVLDRRGIEQLPINGRNLTNLLVTGRHKCAPTAFARAPTISSSMAPRYPIRSTAKAPTSARLAWTRSRNSSWKTTRRRRSSAGRPVSF
jgi:hypothetical protein